MILVILMILMIIEVGARSENMILMILIRIVFTIMMLT